jgi:hypothetical protein
MMQNEGIVEPSDIIDSVIIDAALKCPVSWSYSPTVGQIILKLDRGAASKALPGPPAKAKYARQNTSRKMKPKTAIFSRGHIVLTDFYEASLKIFT